MSGIAPTESLGGVPVSQAVAIAQAYEAQTAQTGAPVGSPSGVDPLSAFAAAQQSLTLLEQQFEGVNIEAVLLNEAYDETGALGDVVDVTFTISGRPGMFQVHVPFAINWQALAFVQIGLKHATVEGIYQGLSVPAVIPQPTTPGGAPAPPAPIPQPGQPIPV